MHRPWPVRLLALVLALLLLGGGGRLPVVDGIVFHHQAGSIPSGAGLLAADAVAPHGAADHLATGFPSSGITPQPDPPVRAAPPVLAPESLLAAGTPRAHQPDPLTRPRAPPARA